MVEGVVLCTFIHVMILYGHTYSATWPPGVRRLAESYMTDPFQVSVGTLDLKVCVQV